jgi:hypothetical protein
VARSFYFPKPRAKSKTSQNSNYITTINLTEKRKNTSLTTSEVFFHPISTNPTQNSCNVHLQMFQSGIKWYQVGESGKSHLMQ